MTTTDTAHPVPTDDLPAAVRGFLAAHADRDVPAAATFFTDDAVVTDQGETFRGTDGVHDFLTRAGSEYTYTSELVGARHVDDTRWVAVVRLEGDFPGGVTVLDYRVALADGRIAELTIG